MAVPPAPPTRAPIAEPFVLSLLLRRLPRNAPAPADPPILAASLPDLLLPFWAHDARIGTTAPPGSLILVNCRARLAAPPIFGCGTASVTLPVISDEAGITVTPSTRMSWSKRPVNMSPGRFVLLESARKRTTCREVPGARVFTIGVGGAGTAGSDGPGLSDSGPTRAAAVASRATAGLAVPETGLFFWVGLIGRPCPDRAAVFAVDNCVSY